MKEPVQIVTPLVLSAMDRKERTASSAGRTNPLAPMEFANAQIVSLELDSKLENAVENAIFLVPDAPELGKLSVSDAPKTEFSMMLLENATVQKEPEISEQALVSQQPQR